MEFVLMKEGETSKKLRTIYLDMKDDPDDAEKGLEQLANLKFGRLEEKLSELTLYYRCIRDADEHYLAVNVVPDIGTEDTDIFFRPKGIKLVRLGIAPKLSPDGWCGCPGEAVRFEPASFEFRIIDTPESVIYHVQFG